MTCMKKIILALFIMALIGVLISLPFVVENRLELIGYLLVFSVTAISLVLRVFYALYGNNVDKMDDLK